MSKSKLLSSLQHNINILRNTTTGHPTPAGISDGDRIRYWDNYNINLAKRISIIKSQYG
jgi:hypothetical protein